MTPLAPPVWPEGGDLWTYFEWDEAKNASNLIKHGLWFENAARIFRGETLQQRDDRQVYGEERWTALGTVDGTILFIVYTVRVGRIRIISARKARRDERQIYLSETDRGGTQGSNGSPS
jgi:uncharacterized DUF497 family protein